MSWSWLSDPGRALAQSPLLWGPLLWAPLALAQGVRGQCPHTLKEALGLCGCPSQHLACSSTQKGPGTVHGVLQAMGSHALCAPGA